MEIFPYQALGAQWLASKRLALLADEMGLGKSAQVIIAADQVRAKRVLILCPANARINWEREFTRWSNGSRTFCLIKDKKVRPSPTDSVICSYDLAPTLPDLGAFDLLVLDEAHFLKSHETKRTKAVFGRHGLIRRASRTWAISGTPMPNHPGELWPILFTFGVTSLKYGPFVDRYCKYWESQYGRQITGAVPARIPELRELLSKMMLRRKKEEVMKELPAIHYTDLTVEAGEVDLHVDSSLMRYISPVDRTAELHSRLDEERKYLAMSVDRLGFTTDGMKSLEAMAGSVSTLRKYTGLQKVEPVAEILKEELSSGAYGKIVIFAVHRDVVMGLRARLAEFEPVTLFGGTQPTKAQKNIDRFQNDPKCRVFIGNIQAAGTAITLTSAHQVIFIEQSWVPGENAQAAMRCHRIGQTKPVFVRFVGLADSIDEKVARVLKRKTRDAIAIFDDPGLLKTQSAANSASAIQNEGEGL